MMDRETGLALAKQVRENVVSLIDRRMAELPAPEVNLTSNATVDTTAIGAALREGLAALVPVIESSVSSADEIRAGIAAAVAGWVRDDASIARAIGDYSADLSPLVDAISGLVFADYTAQLGQLSKEIGQLRLATDAQTAAIKDQTVRIEAASMATRSVSYDKDGRVTQIRVGK
jgi:hypothetical protein